MSGDDVQQAQLTWKPLAYLSII